MISVALFISTQSVNMSNIATYKREQNRETDISFTSLVFVPIVHEEVCCKGMDRMFLERYSY
jgi:hypothetical protein